MYNMVIKLYITNVVMYRKLKNYFIIQSTEEIISPKKIINIEVNRNEREFPDRGTQNADGP